MASTGMDEDTTQPLSPADEATERLGQPTEREAGSRRRPPYGLLVLLIVLAGTAAALFAGVSAARNLLPDLPEFRNPFTAEPETVDRSQPAVLQAIEDLSEYRAATGHLQVIVDLEQEIEGLPPFLRGERTLFVAVGTVDASVDLSQVGGDAVTVSEDRESVTLRLPPPTMGDASIDPERSYVFDRRRGLLDRLGGVFSENPTSERELYLVAEEQMQEAAAETDLLDSA
ncbi:MAG: DUF4230 domain-containing protein, partial [Nitriliruptorales bacterium]|nr:DUF4230 domain-containing protein [Nitriliruptorales bacterium]